MNAGSSMSMLVMQIRQMSVFMFHVWMLVSVAVLPAGHFRVSMTVVSVIMGVAVLMHLARVVMGMPVRLKKDHPSAKEHHREGYAKKH